jgi:hypothetical protein
MEVSSFLKTTIAHSVTQQASGCLQLGSKRLQWDQGGGATSFLLRDLECRDVNSIPTAPTKPQETKDFLPTQSAIQARVSN